MSIKEQLRAVLRSRVGDGAWTWICDASSIAANGNRDQLLLAYTAVSQRVGNAPLNAAPLLSGEGVVLEAWTLEDAARAVILLSKADGSESGPDFAADATACYEQGDAREQ